MIRPYIALFSAAVLSAGLSQPLKAQTTTPRPTQAQAEAAMTDPAIRARIAAQVKASGKSPDQIRTQLKAMGYSDDVINQIIGGAGVEPNAALSADVFAAVKALGIMDSTAVDSLRTPFLQRQRARASADTALMDSVSVALQNDSIRTAIQQLLSSPAARRVKNDSGFVLYGREMFARRTTQFDPSVNGPLPPDYRIGFGDEFTLVLTGGVERAEDLAVTRDGWVVLKDVGQVPATNLTFEQLRSTLGTRLGRVYSGINTGTTHFSIVPKRVGVNQIFVLGDVASPNAYQISRLGTVLTALYAAGGPNENGDARAIDVKRNNRVIATLDLYEYLMTGSASSDVRLENGDVVFVRAQGPRVRVSGAVVRPATYELKAGETLADAIRMAGGFRPEADERRVQIDRFVPASQRGPAGSDKAVLDVPGELLSNQKMESGDVVRVSSVATRVTNQITVEGNVWSPSRVALTPGMRLSNAIAAAGGLKSDTYLGTVQISRLQADSTRRLMRVAMRADHRPVDDIVLEPYDVVTTYSVSQFSTDRYVTVGGAVKRPRSFLYQEGMTVRDAILLAGGLEESALLTYAEIARLPESRANGVTARTIQIPLDSTYLFERSPDGKYLGPPGIPAPTQVLPDVPLAPYDAISILRQPDFEYQRTVSISGRVKYAGKYSLKTKTERLTDLIERAGGMAADADSSAIVFIRQRDSTGRIGVDLPKVLRDKNYVDNLILVDRDSIDIPAYNAIVMIRGEVNAARASTPAVGVAYVSGADVDYYIRAAGGGTSQADTKKAYVIQPNGKVETKRRFGMLYSSIPRPRPGAVIQVPAKDASEHSNWVALAQTSMSLLASLITVAALLRK